MKTIIFSKIDNLKVATTDAVNPRLVQFLQDSETVSNHCCSRRAQEKLERSGRNPNNLKLA